jgi:hypothetical protein
VAAAASLWAVGESKQTSNELFQVWGSSTPEYGFVFIRRETERRLLTLTPRDLYDTTQQSFSPFT